MSAVLLDVSSERTWTTSQSSTFEDAQHAGEVYNLHRKQLANHARLPAFVKCHARELSVGGQLETLTTHSHPYILQHNLRKVDVQISISMCSFKGDVWPCSRGSACASMPPTYVFDHKIAPRAGCLSLRPDLVMSLLCRRCDPSRSTCVSTGRLLLADFVAKV